MRAAVALVLVAACALPEEKRLGAGEVDADVTAADARPVDAAPIDADPDAPDAEPTPIDATPIDATPIDATPIDATPIDGSPIDAMPVDAMPPSPVGDYAPLGGATTLPGGYIMGRRFSLSGAVTVMTAGLYLPAGSPASGMVKFAIYDDNGLAASAPTTFVAGSGNEALDGETREEIALSASIGPGTYWLFVATDTNVSVGYADSNDRWGAIQMKSYATAFGGTLTPAPSTSGTSDAVNLYLIVQ